MKKNAPEPDPVRVVQIGLDVDILTDAETGTGDVMTASGIEHRTFNLLPQEMLRAVPGVSPQVLERLILDIGNITEIANMDVEQLDPYMGKEAARQVVGFFRKSVFDGE